MKQTMRSGGLEKTKSAAETFVVPRRLKTKPLSTSKLKKDNG